MFSGIIQSRGLVKKAVKRQDVVSCLIQPLSGSFAGRCDKMLRGESVCVSGACLTVTRVDKAHGFWVDMVPETLNCTAFKRISAGEQVNLERSLRLNERISGHFVMGHVDGVGTVKTLKKIGKSFVLKVHFPAHLSLFVSRKGCVAVDGVSLTVTGCGRGWFNAALIPFTARETTLGFKKAGDLVNLEMDILARYVKKMLNDEC